MSDGEEEPKRITTFRSTIILSDLVMPHMGSFDLLLALKDEGGDLVTEGRRLLNARARPFDTRIDKCCDAPKRPT